MIMGLFKTKPYKKLIMMAKHDLKHTESED